MRQLHADPMHAKNLSLVAGEPAGLFSVLEQCWRGVRLLQRQSRSDLLHSNAAKYGALLVPSPWMSLGPASACLTAIQAGAVLCCSAFSGRRRALLQPSAADTGVLCPPRPAAIKLLPVHLSSILQPLQPVLGPPAERATAQHHMFVVGRQLSGSAVASVLKQPCSVLQPPAASAGAPADPATGARAGEAAAHLPPSSGLPACGSGVWVRPGTRTGGAGRSDRVGLWVWR